MNDHFFDLLTGAWKTQLLIASVENETLPPRMQRALDRVYPDQAIAPNQTRQMKRMLEYWKELPVRTEIPPASSEDHRIYMEAQDEKARCSLGSFLDQADMGDVRKLLDVGGGTAPYLRGIQKRYPDILTTYMDIEAASVLAKEKGLTGEIVTGDFREGDWGEGYDLILMSQIIHMYDDDSVRNLFAKAAKALAGKGRLLIVEHFIDPEDDPFNFLFDINMYLGTEGGRCRRRKEVTELASDAFTKEKEYMIDKRTGVLELRVFS